MDHNDTNLLQTEFSKSLLSGVFAGIVATVLCLFFDVVFRYYSGFPLSTLINVATIIFVVVLVVTVSGIIFYFFHHYVKKGVLFYQLASAVVTALLLFLAMQAHRSPDQHLSHQFTELLSGVIIIAGLSIIFLVPFTFKHDYV